MTGGPSITRRTALLGLAAGTVGLPGFGVSRLAFAQAGGAGGERRALVLVLLRGGFDGLSLIPVPGDPDYAKARGSLALPPPGAAHGAIDLDGRFALHPAAASLLPAWRAGRLAIVPAAATPYRGTNGAMDHLAAQRVFAAGTADPESPAARSGWLNRALTAKGGGATPALALGAEGPPEVLAGPAAVEAAPAAVLGRPVPGLLEKTAGLYRDDTLFAPALAAAEKRRALPAETLGLDHVQKARAGARGLLDLPAAGSLVAGRIAEAEGPVAAVIEISGFDTHFGGGADRRAAALAGGLMTLAGALGEGFGRTIIVAASEFGRTVAPNASGGTDHGLAAPMLCLGGPVIGGIKGGWPGLAEASRAANGGVAPTVDARAVLKRLLADHWGLTTAQLDGEIFPDARDVAPLKGLVRERG